jgi:DMSO/TMAO reductase YedYZ molybdopterin-dependent catalytic subunit
MAKVLQQCLPVAVEMAAVTVTGHPSLRSPKNMGMPTSRRCFWRPEIPIRAREYAAHVAKNFSEWTVDVVGLVQTPMSWSLAALNELPSRTQVTRHDCVEDWSAIGKWTGVPLGDLLRQVTPLPNAKFAVFHSADVDEDGIPYYESMALADCYHPQAILAYELNDTPLDIPHGAPIRLRFEQQLGYKQAKYVTMIELVETLSGTAGGKGGYWEDDQGCEWYAGI